MTDQNVLVVEDDPAVGALLDKGLGEAGFVVKVVNTAGGAMRQIADFTPLAVLLDVNLPDGSGNDLCRSLRRTGFEGPILFLSAMGDVADRADGLVAGGDDYIVKPFVFEELVARLQTHLLRRGQNGAARTIPTPGGLSLDFETRQAHYKNVTVRLTQRESELLALFMEAPNKPISRGEIFDRLWLEQGGASLNVVDVYIGYLRGKMGEVVKAGGPSISTVRGRGFMLELPR